MRGVFRRPAPQPAPLDWQTFLPLAPDIRSYKIHAGGITALGEQGYRHYLPLALLHLCGSRATISCHGYRA
ncbi:AbiEi antitoxin N-terminal domain-containing protein [Rhizobium sullae]|uniref:AbiEi antitoxin N-terminal domain-containing protein n=1 Tax=Rhizobium sullae TaxID=50338 RepID=UPI001FD3E18B|nr:AbiEi antitoxin N-terminal domain-containing protein [Rhizobium sullae]